MEPLGIIATVFELTFSYLSGQLLPLTYALLYDELPASVAVCIFRVKSTKDTTKEGGRGRGRGARGAMGRGRGSLKRGHTREATATVSGGTKKEETDKRWVFSRSLL